MKNQDKFTLSVLRMLKSALQLEKIQAKKDLEDKIDEIKKQINDAMTEYDVTSVRTSFLNISKTSGSTSYSIDTKLLKEKDPVLYEELLDKYGKTTTRKGSIVFKVS